MSGGEKEKDFSSTSSHGSEDSKSGEQVKQNESGENLDKPDDKCLELLGESEMGRVGLPETPLKLGNSGSTELTLSYLCENPSLGFSFERDFPGKSNSPYSKGKEVVMETSTRQEEGKWIERDFLQLKETKGGASSKRVMEEEENEVERGGGEGRDKKPKLETLKLSLALPDVSLSLTPSNAPPPPNGSSHRFPVKHSRSFQSLAISNNNTQTTCSNDFTAASLSYSYSHPFSHNPSCSLTRNSTENYDYSVGSHKRENDQFWHCGEGTNGSVHSRFRPVGDGISISGHGGTLGHALMPSVNKDPSNSFYKPAGSDNTSFFPSELPARPQVTMPGDSKGRSLDQFQVVDPSEDRAPICLSRPAKIVVQCLSESIPVMAQIFQELSDETINSAKEYLKNLITSSEGKRELAALQKQLERRSDLTKEILSKSHRAQLEILVATKFGLPDFLSKQIRLPTTELVEIFSLVRCRNINCKSMLPVDDCECKICSTKEGFCSQCMCPVCSNFDCANNTCSWVGCDVCSHWCHASCGIEKKLIRPGPSLKGLSGTTEMQFHCLGCGHASEMLGFVKDVFMCCAKDWSLETLIKELDCVGRIFKGSQDVKGKALYLKAQKAIYELERRGMSPSEACNSIFQFFNSTGSVSESPMAARPLKELSTTIRPLPLPVKETIRPLSFSNSLPPTSSSILHDVQPVSVAHINRPSSLLNMPITTDSSHSRIESNIMMLGANPLKGSGGCSSSGMDSLESIVRIKEAEARMFQSRADEARKEAEGYRQRVRERLEKLDEEYADKLAKLCLQETEDRRRKKLEELKLLEASHSDYYNMKMRMQGEIAGLLERMEATKQQWAA